MTGWDTYCCLCGGPAGISGRMYFKSLKQFVSWVKRSRMQIKGDIEEAFRESKKNINWLGKFGAVLENGKIIKGKKVDYGEMQHSKKDFVIVVDPSVWKLDTREKRKLVKGFMTHNWCAEIFTKKMKPGDDMFNILRPLANTRGVPGPVRSGLLKGIDYGPIKKYCQQFFDWPGLILDGKYVWVAQDPRKNVENRRRIEGIADQILKKPRRQPSQRQKERPSPSESATKFAVGTRRVGNDGNMWIVRKTKNGTKRWVRL